MPGSWPPQFDGLLLSGGGDLSPLLFAQEPDPRAGKPDRRRDQEELGLCAAFCAQRKPILGICRGIQVLNVYFGGDLIQHMDGHDSTCHSVQIVPDSALCRLCGETCMVNSYHHQAIGRLGPACAPRHVRPMESSKPSNTILCPFWAFNGIPSAWCAACAWTPTPTTPPCLPGCNLK